LYIIENKEKQKKHIQLFGKNVHICLHQSHCYCQRKLN